MHILKGIAAAAAITVIALMVGYGTIGWFMGVF